MADDSSSGQVVRPIRPFIVGITIGALWAALHVPEVINVASATGLAAVALATAIVSGGALALVAEAVHLGIHFGQTRLRRR